MRLQFLEFGREVLRLCRGELICVRRDDDWESYLNGFVGPCCFYRVDYDGPEIILDQQLCESLVCVFFNNDMSELEWRWEYGTVMWKRWVGGCYCGGKNEVKWCIVIELGRWRDIIQLLCLNEQDVLGLAEELCQLWLAHSQSCQIKDKAKFTLIDYSLGRVLTLRSAFSIGA